MQKQYPQNLLFDEWMDWTGDQAIFKDWGDLLESRMLQTMLMERERWPEKLMAIIPDELIEDDDLWVNPGKLILHLTEESQTGRLNSRIKSVVAPEIDPAPRPMPAGLQCLSH